MIDYKVYLKLYLKMADSNKPYSQSSMWSDVQNDRQWMRRVLREEHDMLSLDKTK
jgi:hypothetical protein